MAKTTVQYQKYELNKANSKNLLATDFSSDFDVEEEHLLQVARDLANFSNNTQDPVDYSSILEIKTDDDLIKIQRNYKEGTSQLTSQRQSDPNFFWLPDDIAEHTVNDKNPYILYPVKESEMVHHLNWLYPSMAKFDVGGTELRSEDEIKQELAQLGGENIHKLEKIESELDVLEADLERQRQVDQAQLSISDLEAQVNDLVNTLQGVEELIQAQKDVYSKLKQYNKEVGSDVVSKAEKIKKHMEELREKKLKYEKELIKLEDQQVDKDRKEETTKPKIAKFLLFLPIILIGLSFLGFIITNNLYVFALGIIGGILEALLYLAINTVEPSLDLDKVNLSTINKTRINAKINADFDLTEKQSKEIQQFFINKAWLSVLKSEFTDLQNAIQTRLGEQNFAQIQTAKNEIEEELGRVRELIASNEGKDIPPGEYLKFKRRLDVLKSEKLKLEQELNQSGDKIKIAKLQAELKLVNKLAETGGGEKITKLPNSFISSVSDKYVAMRQNKEKQLELFDMEKSDWVSEDLDTAHLLAVYTFATLLKWEDHPSLPVIIIDVMTKLPPSANQTISDKIKELKKLGQLIVVSPNSQ